MSRHTCVICKKKRDKKFMLKIPLSISNHFESTSNSWLCKYNVSWFNFNKPSCISNYIDRSRKSLKKVSQDLDVFTAVELSN